MPSALRRGLLFIPLLLLMACGSQPAAEQPPVPTVVVPTTTSEAAAPEATVPAATPSTDETASGQFSLELTQVVDGLDRPVHVTHAGDGSERIFVVEKAGRIRIVDGNALQSEPFLDITDRVGSNGSEQGLLSVAFHPEYSENGQLFVNYTNKRGHTMIERYTRSDDPERADADSATEVLTIAQPAANHNGGQIAFGPDGYLYIGMGDGGRGGDPWGNGQNPDVLLGKMLRIDVNGDAPYAIPADNPFVATEGTRPEIWALGVRNPWRFSFDRQTGDLFIADVGQNALEEVNFQPAASTGGENYGWNIMEGRECYGSGGSCNEDGLTLPITDYGRDLGCSITGGVRYRGADVPAFGSAYFFADWCSGRIWTLTDAGSGTWTMTEVLDSDLGISSFGEDEQGEVYVTDMNGGGLYRLAAGTN